jgi:phage gp29-like protein
MFKKAIAALASLAGISKQGLATLQAPFSLARSFSMMHYESVTTLEPWRLAAAFRQADNGYLMQQAILFELLEEHDAHIFSELAKRRRSITGLGWQMHAPEDANQSEIDRTKELSDMLSGIPHFEDAQYNLTDAIGKGYACLEIDWKTGAQWLPQALNWVPQRLFQVEKDSNNLLLLNYGVPEPLRQWGWVVHEHQSRSGYIESSALFRVLAWTYAYKAYNMQDMQKFLELYGLPLRLGKYPTGIDQKQRKELLSAVQNLGSDGAGIVPSTMTIDFITASKGSIRDFLDTIEYWERKQSLAILGSTLTSQADGKSSTNALGVIHDKVRREIMLHDVRQIEPTLNGQLIVPIVLLNGLFPPDRMPVFKYDTSEPVDQDALVGVLTKGAAIGMEIDVEWAHKAMQIPRAAKDAKLLAVSSLPPNEPPGNTALTSQLLLGAGTRLAKLAANNSVDPIINAYSAQLAALTAPHEEALLQKISAIVADAGSFDEAIAGMEALQADNTDWAAAVQLGMAAANMAGRVNIGGAS